MTYKRMIFFGASAGLGFVIGAGIALSTGVSSDGQRAVPEGHQYVGEPSMVTVEAKTRSGKDIQTDAVRNADDRSNARYEVLGKKATGNIRDGFRFDGYLYFKVSAYTKHDDPGFGKRYASINFLRGGTKYNPKLPRYPLVSTYVDDGHYSAAIPKSMRFIHEELCSDGYHKWFLHVPGYNSDSWDKGYMTIPRDRITKYDRLDVLMTGYRSQHRARKFGVKKIRIELWERIDK